MWSKLSRLNPLTRKRNKRLQQYLEIEEIEYRDAIECVMAERAEKERQIDMELFREKREGSNRLENREMRMETLVHHYERALIAARVDTRKRLGSECPELLSEAQLSKLEGIMRCSVQVARQARRGNYERRARAAGVPIFRPEQRDAAPYGDLETLIQREIRKLSLARSLGRLAKPPAGAFLPLSKKIWHDLVWSKVIAWVITGGALTWAIAWWIKVILAW